MYLLTAPAPVALLPALTPSTIEEIARPVRHTVLHRVPQSINVHAPHPVPCCKAADPTPLRTLLTLTNVAKHKRELLYTDSCFGEPPISPKALANPKPMPKYEHSAPQKQLVMVSKSGPDVKNTGSWSYWSNQPMEPLPGYSDTTAIARQYAAGR